MKPYQPYSDRDDIIVISDEAHRNQSAGSPEQSDLDPDQSALLQKLLGKHFAIIAADFVEHFTTRWEPYTLEEKQALAQGVNTQVWQRAVRGDFQSRSL